MLFCLHPRKTEFPQRKVLFARWVWNSKVSVLGASKALGGLGFSSDLSSTRACKLMNLEFWAMKFGSILICHPGWRFFFAQKVLLHYAFIGEYPFALPLSSSHPGGHLLLVRRLLHLPPAPAGGRDSKVEQPPEHRERRRASQSSAGSPQESGDPTG